MSAVETVPAVEETSKVDIPATIDVPTTEPASAAENLKEEAVPIASLITAETPAPEGTAASQQPANEENKITEDKPATVAPEDKTEQTETTKEVRPKSPSILAKLLAPFKGDKKHKDLKSPKKDKKKEETVKKDEAPAPAAAEAAPTTEDVPASDAPVAEATTVEGTSAPAGDAVKESVNAPVDEPSKEPAAETPAPANEDAKQEEKPKETVATSRPKPSAAKVGRRLSARVGEFFKPKSKEREAVQSKVDENPPKIDEPAPVAPLENPAAGEAKPEAPTSATLPEETTAPAVETSELPKPVDAAPAASPVVAAAA